MPTAGRARKPGTPVSAGATRRSGAGFDLVREIGLALPEVTEGTSYGTPALKRGGTLMARQHQDGESLVVRTDFDSRDVLLQAEPETCYVTDHYRDYPWILVRLASVERDFLRRLIEEAWRRSAPKRPTRSGTAARRARGRSRPG